jgi:hypothetical protein
MLHAPANSSVTLFRVRLVPPLAVTPQAIEVLVSASSAMVRRWCRAPAMADN